MQVHGLSLINNKFKYSYRRMNRAKSVELDIDTIAASAEFSPMMTHSELN